MMRSLDSVAWPLERLNEALSALARFAAPERRHEELPAPPSLLSRAPTRRLSDWLEAAGATLGLEVEPVGATYFGLTEMLGRAAPAMLRIPGREQSRYLVLVGRGRRYLTCLGPDRRRRRISLSVVRDALCEQLEEPLKLEIDRLLGDLDLPPRRAEKARRALLRERLAARPVGGCWLLRLPAGASFWRQIRQEGLFRLGSGILGSHLAQQILLILSWWVLGLGALQNRIDPGWLVAWALLLLSMTPFRAAELWSLGKLTAAGGALLKRRLLAGALRLAPDEVREEGIGHFLGRVHDSEAVEKLALSGGHVGLIASIELLLALPILALGAGGWLHGLLLLIWTALSVALWWRYLETRRRWTESRLGMTHDLVEKMVGHRTRLAQQAPERWHQEDDQALESYLESGREMDRRGILLIGLVPRGWLLLGLLGLAPAFAAGSASVAKLAIGVGGLLFAYRALWKLTRGLFDLAEAMVAWQNVAPLFFAAARPRQVVPPELVVSPALTEETPKGEPILEARELAFRFQNRPAPVLEGCSLEIAAGDRVLMEGASGSGKSTLASLLVGLRSPQAGLLLLKGIDRQTVGEKEWRRRVVAAPQFHENHVLTETFAFNLLMGRDWPPSIEDLELAEELCRQLGLGDLIDRMPAGLQQMVGESGWQLSHGEKTRLFIARALLQESEVVVLDESFAALDPETFEQALDCADAHASTLVLIAHP